MSIRVGNTGVNDIIVDGVIVDRLYFNETKLYEMIRRSVPVFTGSNWGTLTEAIVLDGDFEIDIELTVDSDVVTTANTAGAYLLSDSNTSPSFRLMLYINKLWFGERKFDIAGINFKKVNTITVKREADILTAHLNGNELIADNGNGELSTFVIDRIGTKWGGDTAVKDLKGSIFNINIWSNGDRTTGTKCLSLNFKDRDEDYHNGIPERFDLIPNGEFDDGENGWNTNLATFSVTDGQATITSTADIGNIFYVFPEPIYADAFEIRWNVVSATEDKSVVQIYSDDLDTPDLAIINTGIGEQVAHYSTGGVISKISIGTELANNTLVIESIQVKIFEGKDLWGDDTSEYDLNWTSADDEYTRKGGGVATLDEATVYKVTFDLDITEGSIRYSSGTYQTGYYTQSGRYSLYLPKGETSPKFQNGAGVTTATVSNVEIIRWSGAILTNFTHGANGNWLDLKKEESWNYWLNTRNIDLTDMTSNGDFTPINKYVATVVTSQSVAAFRPIDKTLYLVIGYPYICQFEVSDFLGDGRVGLGLDSFGGGSGVALNDRSLNGNGNFYSELIATGKTLSIFRYIEASGTGSNKISQVRVQQKLYVG